MSLGILCPGQGDQYPGMFDLLHNEPAARPAFHALADVLGCDPQRLPADVFHLNTVAQPLVCAVEMAMFAVLRDRIEAPSIFAGYSVGELAAYGCTGAIAFADILTLARTRATLMDAACTQPNGLIAVRGLEQAAIAGLCLRTGCFLAIANDQDRFIVGGLVESLHDFKRAAIDAGAKVTALKIAVASHTPLMAMAASKFKTILADYAWKTPSAPILAGISGAAIRQRSPAIDALSNQIDHTLNWQACLVALIEYGCTALLELGPGSSLSRIARERFPHVPARSCSDFSSIDGIADWISRASQTGQ
jgi:[acyl-carrier-protein] S-malonyltransferase